MPSRKRKRVQMMMWINIPTIIILVATLLFLYRLDKNHGLLRDMSRAGNRPFSFGRVQLAWWTYIVFAGIIYITINSSAIPVINTTCLILLGMSITATYIAKTSDAKELGGVRHQDLKSEGLLLDLISNNGGVSMPRVQALLFNVAFGIYFIYSIVNEKKLSELPLENMALLGISTSGYLINKTTENKGVVAENSEGSN